MISAAPHIPKIRLANKADAAEFFGVSLPTINSWIAKGCPVVQKGSRGVPWVLDLLEMASWRFGGESSSEDDIDPDRLTPKERLDWYRGEKEKRGMQIDDGLLIPAMEVEREIADLVELMVTTVETIPDLLERDAGISGGAVARAHEVVDDLRSRLYQRMKGKVVEDEL